MSLESNPDEWVKSSFSASGNCCEVNMSDSSKVRVRDSKNVAVGITDRILDFTTDEWRTLVGMVGESLECTASFPGGTTTVIRELGYVGLHVLTRSDNPGVVLEFTRSEMAAFSAGARNGEFDRSDDIPPTVYSIGTGVYLGA